ncbi:MAG: hypothetical protein WC623_07825 [Pedobacter sp.]|uniref:hypothetical protein n=1 Tax=Pedobacter sp. TaxID=1411316 RepID=UPI00356980C6
MVELFFHRMGIPKAMLKFLRPYLLKKYDMLISIGINDNFKRIAHEKAGWEVIYENEFNYYFIYDSIKNQ